MRTLHATGHSEALLTHTVGMDIAIHRENETAFTLAVVNNGGNDLDTKRTADLFAASPLLLAALKEAYVLMPLGTAKRADWMRRAMDAMSKAEGR